MQLRPHQIAPARELLNILSRHQSAVDLSDCGTGKTYVACAAIAALKLPTLVIGPKISEHTWKSVAAGFGEEIDYLGYEKLRTGSTPFGWWDNPLRSEEREYYVCENCQQKWVPAKPHPCYCHPAGVHCIQVKKKDWNYGRFNFHPGIKFIVADEMHRCGGRDSLNADMLIATKRQNIKVLGLSATAACNPLNLRAIGYLLDLHNLDSDRMTLGRVEGKPSFYRWAARYGVRKDPRFHGFKWLVGEQRQRECLLEIRDSVIPKRGVRVSTKDIPGFPACQITAELYDIEAAEKVNWLYAQMAEALAELERTKEADKCPELPLTVILRARQQIELLKVPLAVELAKDYEEKGFSVALFVNFKQTIAELAKRLETGCIIDGSVTGFAREASIAAFQSNLSHYIIANNEAGGVSVSLHDLHDRPRVGLVMPMQSATSFRQVAGRLPRDGGKSPALYRVLFAANTYEEQLQRMLRGKLNNLDTLNDADLNPENLRMAA